MKTQEGHAKRLPGAMPVYEIDGVTQIDVFTPFVQGWEDATN